MVIIKDLQKYIIHQSASVREALKKIRSGKMRIIFAVDEQNRLKGLLSMGDILRWVVDQELTDLNVPVGDIVNTNFHYVYAGAEKKDLQKIFSKKHIHTVPILTKQMVLVAIACLESNGIAVGDFVIDDESPAYIIAEIGNNHNGSMKLARKLVDKAAMAGADCIKFQMRNMESLYSNCGNPDDPTADLGAQYVLDLLAKHQLSTEEMLEIFDYTREKGVEPLCTPWDEASVDVLEDYGMAAYKVASADLTNYDLLRKIASTRKPMFCSTGMSTEREIQEAVSLLQEEGAQFILLHCNSTYPTPFRDVNLRYMKRLQEIGDCPVGYSGHERGIYVPVAAVSMGAKVIEKHFTLNRTMEGNDHKVSLLPHEFAEMVNAVRTVEESMGDPNRRGRVVSQGEMMNREILGKSLVAICPIAKGTVITEDMIIVRSPGKGLPPYRKMDLIGSKAKRDFLASDFFYLSDLEEEEIKARNYNFTLPWGIPVRFHDWRDLSQRSNMDLVEFHLSYKDLDLRVSDYFDSESNMDFLVHSPELFSGDHILDLCSTDKDYREHSIREFKRVVEMTLEIAQYFPKTTRPRIITNIGGFSDSSFLDSKRKSELLSNFKKSLEELRLDTYEILPQTMPPFPWHFGGQRYHNILVDVEDIRSLCENEDMRICLDVSHSQLACNHMKWSMEEFLTEVIPFTSHLHLADADGLDGEGLQIGDGSIDFSQLSRIIYSSNVNVSFIPEIWQGHKNEGEGFWLALGRLERYFSKDLNKKLE